MLTDFHMLSSRFIRRWPFQTLTPSRCLCRTTRDEEGHSNPSRTAANDENKIHRETTISEDGKVLYDLHPGIAFDESYDWKELQKNLGLDKLTDEDFEREWAEIEKSSGYFECYEHELPEDEFEIPAVLDGSSPKDINGGFTVADEKGSIKYEDQHGSIEIEHDVMPGFAKFLSQSNMNQHQKGINNHPDSIDTSEQSVSNNKTNQERNLKHRKSGSNRLNRELQNTLKERVQSESNALRQPKNQQKPGNEHRVMSLESEMEKIAADVLCKPDVEWYSQGADLRRVLLSPNMQKLTVYYDIDHSSIQTRRWWKKMNDKYEKLVRSALATRLETKYVPKVFFVQGDPEEAKKNEIDSIFQRIAEERS